MATKNGRTRATAFAIPFALVATFGAVAGGSYWALTTFDGGLRTGRCSASGLDTSHTYSTEQTLNAATISAVAVDRGMPPRAASIALATAYQESQLENIDYGDRDSVGLFQQRPSQGWGTKAQILDPIYAINKFYDGLEDVKGYESMDITVAAQKVQRSGYPDAYAEHEVEGRLFASALTGQSAGELQCDLKAAGGPGNPNNVRSHFTATYPRLAKSGKLTATLAKAPTAKPKNAGSTVLKVNVKGDESRGWSVANWAVARAAHDQIVAVDYQGQRWDREHTPSDSATQWKSDGAPESGKSSATEGGTVIIYLASGGK